MLDTSRALLTRLYQAAVEGAAPFPRTHDAVAAWLRDQGVDRIAQARVHIFALGKAAPAMFRGAAHALAGAGVPVAGGVVVCATMPEPIAGDDAVPQWPVPVVTGDHPVPGPGSLDAGDEIETAVHEVRAGDVVIVLLSGGTSALAAAPVAALSQAIGDAERAQTHIANLAETLLESGLAIGEMNAIRRRVLRWGAGRLAVALHARGAERIAAFAISDVIGDHPSVIGSGPCSPDPLDDASFLALVDAHDVRGSLERSMGEFLGILGGGLVPAVPAPSLPAFGIVTYRLVARNTDAIAALARAAQLAGLDEVVIDDDPLAGDAAVLGDALARRALLAARELRRHQRVLFVAGGEPVVNLRATLERAWDDGDRDDAARDAEALGDETTADHSIADRTIAERTVTDEPSYVDARDLLDSEPDARLAASDEPMRGGRMQVLALAAALALEAAGAQGNRDAWRITVLAAGTDGRDGPTDAAGAIVDAAVPALARRAGRHPERDGATGRSYYPLDAASALLRPGPTGTNVMDVVAILVG